MKYYHLSIIESLLFMDMRYAKDSVNLSNKDWLNERYETVCDTIGGVIRGICHIVLIMVSSMILFYGLVGSPIIIITSWIIEGSGFHIQGWVGPIFLSTYFTLFAFLLFTTVVRFAYRPRPRHKSTLCKKVVW